MRPEFAITKNVENFMSGVEQVQTPIRGRIGMMVIFGPPGSGKTETGMWYAAKKNIPYIRAKDITTRRSLLANIVAELGEAPAYRSDQLFDQAAEQLIMNPQPVIIDEIDYLVRDGMIEVLRDLNDITNSAMILMGMEHADKKLKRFRHFYDRISAIVKFELFGKKEIGNLATRICEVELDPSAIAYIHQQSGGKLRLTTTWFSLAERISKQNGIDKIFAEHLQGSAEGVAR